MESFFSHCKVRRKNILKEDEFIYSFIAGLSGGIIMSITDLILTKLNYVENAYYDWAYSLITGFSSNNFLELITGQITHYIFAGCLGILFSLFIKKIGTKYILFKGWFFGVVVWFSVHVIVNLFHFQPLNKIPLSQVISDLITASIFGITLVNVYFYLKRKS